MKERDVVNFLIRVFSLVLSFAAVMMLGIGCLVGIGLVLADQPLAGVLTLVGTVVGVPLVFGAAALLISIEMQLREIVRLLSKPPAI